MTRVRVALPAHLRTLAGIDDEVEVDVGGGPSVGDVLDALEARFPMLRGTIRGHGSDRRRDFIRFFADGQDLSLAPLTTPLPEAVLSGAEPLIVIGAIAGGKLVDRH